MVKVLDSNNQHVWKCLECGKISKYITNLKGHVEANHFEGLQFNCGLCPKVFKSRGSLRNHISNIHKEKHGPAPFPLWVWFVFVFICFWANKDVLCNFCWIQMKNISWKSWLLLFLFILFKSFTCFQSTSLIWIWTKRLSGGWIGLWGEMARGSFTAAEFAQELTKIKQRWDITLRLILTAITVVQFVSSNIKQEEP